MSEMDFILKLFSEMAFKHKLSEISWTNMEAKSGTRDDEMQRYFVIFSSSLKEQKYRGQEGPRMLTSRSQRRMPASLRMLTSPAPSPRARIR